MNKIFNKFKIVIIIYRINLIYRIKNLNKI